MQPEAMVTTLKSLKLFGMAQAVEELAAQSSPAYLNAQSILDSLLKAELAEREVRSVNYQMKIARFPAYRDLSGFDFTQSVANEALVRHLHRGEFMDSAHNVVLIGGPGTGKTHLATAISVQAIMHAHRRVRFFSTVDLVNALEQEKLAGRQGQIAHRLVHADLVILDELGLSAVQPERRGLAVSSDEQALREDQPDHHDQSEFLGMGEHLWRSEDDDRAARPADPSLPDRRNRQ
jgi:DNA replication protein DnaC